MLMSTCVNCNIYDIPYRSVRREIERIWNLILCSQDNTFQRSFNKILNNFEVEYNSIQLNFYFIFVNIGILKLIKLV